MLRENPAFDDDLLERIGHRLARRERREIPAVGLRPAAVAVPLVRGDGELSVLFTVRTAHVEHHKGEISFPGGRVESTDRDTLAAALRETWEEVGVRPEHLRVLGSLDDYVSVSDYRVTPWVVYLDEPAYPFVAQPDEVAEILLVPLSHLTDRTHYRVERPRSGPYPIHHFRWGQHVIWGLTAAILKRLLDLSFGFSATP